MVSCSSLTIDGNLFVYAVSWYLLPWETEKERVRQQNGINQTKKRLQKYHKGKIVKANKAVGISRKVKNKETSSNIKGEIEQWSKFKRKY